MSDCVHRFRIAEAHGPVSVGVCRHCGEQREFHNADRQDRDFTGSAWQKAQRAAKGRAS